MCIMTTSLSPRFPALRVGTPLAFADPVDAATALVAAVHSALNPGMERSEFISAVSAAAPRGHEAVEAVCGEWVTLV